ncbi:unnamed protein product [Calicophoron daubneyi]|uniref:Uncharacterized protein n=1 Tax=Calicophoron daubneyi TaxID=300641 RepID=A0AAV2TFQ5_CALDB
MLVFWTVLLYVQRGFALSDYFIGFDLRLPYTYNCTHETRLITTQLIQQPRLCFDQRTRKPPNFIHSARISRKIEISHEGDSDLHEFTYWNHLTNSRLEQFPLVKVSEKKLTGLILVHGNKVYGRYGLSGTLHFLVVDAFQPIYWRKDMEDPEVSWKIWPTEKEAFYTEEDPHFPGLRVSPHSQGKEEELKKCKSVEESVELILVKRNVRPKKKYRCIHLYIYCTAISKGRVHMRIFTAQFNYVDRVVYAPPLPEFINLQSGPYNHTFSMTPKQCHINGTRMGIWIELSKEGVYEIVCSSQVIQIVYAFDFSRITFKHLEREQYTLTGKPVPLTVWDPDYPEVNFDDLIQRTCYRLHPQSSESIEQLAPKPGFNHLACYIRIGKHHHVIQSQLLYFSNETKSAVELTSKQIPNWESSASKITPYTIELRFAGQQLVGKKYITCAGDFVYPFVYVLTEQLKEVTTCQCFVPAREKIFEITLTIRPPGRPADNSQTIALKDNLEEPGNKSYNVDQNVELRQVEPDNKPASFLTVVPSEHTFSLGTPIPAYTCTSKKSRPHWQIILPGTGRVTGGNELSPKIRASGVYSYVCHITIDNQNHSYLLPIVVYRGVPPVLLPKTRSFRLDKWYICTSDSEPRVLVSELLQVSRGTKPMTYGNMYAAVQFHDQANHSVVIHCHTTITFMGKELVSQRITVEGDAYEHHELEIAPRRTIVFHGDTIECKVTDVPPDSIDTEMSIKPPKGVHFEHHGGTRITIHPDTVGGIYHVACSYNPPNSPHLKSTKRYELFAKPTKLMLNTYQLHLPGTLLCRTNGHKILNPKVQLRIVSGPTNFTETLPGGELFVSYLNYYGHYNVACDLSGQYRNPLVRTSNISLSDFFDVVFTGPTFEVCVPIPTHYLQFSYALVILLIILSFGLVLLTYIAFLWLCPLLVDTEEEEDLILVSPKAERSTYVHLRMDEFRKNSYLKLLYLMILYEYWLQHQQYLERKQRETASTNCSLPVTPMERTTVTRPTSGQDVSSSVTLAERVRRRRK